MRRTKYQKYRAFAGLFSGRRPKHLAGEAHLGDTDRAELLIGLSVDHLRDQIGKTRTYRGEHCKVGHWLSEEAKRTGRIDPDELLAAAAHLRALQRRGGTEGERIGVDAFSASATRLLGRYKGQKENSVRLLIINDGTDASSEAFNYNVRKLAQDLGCALAQKAIITSIDRTPVETYEHSPTGMPDPE